MYRANHAIAQATPETEARRSRLKLILGISGSLLIGIALFLIAKQWHPVDTVGDSVDNIHVEKDDVAAEQMGSEPGKVRINKSFLRAALGDYIEAGEFPSAVGYNDHDLYINYTIDKGLQDWAEARLNRYNPDYGVFVALEPDTGEILALATNRRDGLDSSELAFRGTYPAASVFKMITAAAVLEEGIAKPDTVFEFNGKSTSLYKRQVYEVVQNKWTRRMSFETAFAKSVNPIFGRLGANKLGPETLLNYAERFGFNARFASDFKFDNGSVRIDTSDKWQAAESAAGYTRRNTLSPIHGAVLAASIANGGKLISPSIVQSVTNERNQVLYTLQKPQSIDVISTQAAQSMQTLMRATITNGTGRKSFRSMSKKKYGDVIKGGKSGHLSGAVPKGQYDWFVGYAERDSQKIAYAMLCINKEKWYVKSARFAREAVEHYFKADNSRMATQDLNNSKPIKAS